MRDVTSVQEMSRTIEPDSQAEVAALREVSRLSAKIAKNEAITSDLREQRNRAIVEAARYARNDKIASAANVRQSYISRVVRANGKPESGSAIDKERPAR